MGSTRHITNTGAVPGVPVRLRLVARGIVQGVGFRPWVHRLATQASLCGWVANGGDALVVEVEGAEQALRMLWRELEGRPPAGAYIASLETTWLDAVGMRGFEIRESQAAGACGVWVRPDVAPCADCLREIRDSSDRRYRYPFTNCTRCGPRYTILESLPYDRPNTSMRRFRMCQACQAEYDDPADRRFHAQPNACPQCGPRLVLRGPGGECWSEGKEALGRAVDLVRSGAVVAVKGVGGFHLVALAGSAGPVQRLREAKRRDEKPFAVMFPTLDAVRRVCEVDGAEARLLAAPEAPIVLLRRRVDARSGDRQEVVRDVAPGLATLGVMLPSTPLHQLMLDDLGIPVVATSGNLSDEPICTEEQDALGRLAGIADAFLVHDRPIVRHADDSIVRVVAGREMVLRRARGYAPLPLPLGPAHPERVVVGYGAHMKSCIAVAGNEVAVLSQHIGDLDTVEAQAAFRRVVSDVAELNGLSPNVVAADPHPDYPSGRFARESGLPVEWVQHHFAHVVSAMAENELEGEVLGVAWDGTGYGPDGTVWGGEFLRASREDFTRLAHLRTFRLPGGDAASREPRRSALGLLHAWGGRDGAMRLAGGWRDGFREPDRVALWTLLDRGVNAPVTSSIGRLFDAVAAIVGLRQVLRYEGQAAMLLEQALPMDAGSQAPYPLTLGPAGDEAGPWVLDWAPMLEALVADVLGGVGVGVVSARFHNGLAEGVLETARRAGMERVVVAGGCFQNRYLLERVVGVLRGGGFRVYWNQRVPPNDGGIALGQVAVARARGGRVVRGNEEARAA